jgi:hypothetical protein
MIDQKLKVEKDITHENYPDGPRFERSGGVG